jgi:hypothetical protein
MCLPVQLRRAKIGFRMAAEEATDATFREVVLESKGVYVRAFMHMRLELIRKT